MEVIDGNLNISGYVYKENANSFQQYAYVKIEDSESGKVTYAELTMSNLEGHEDILNGKYSAISGSMKVDAGKKYKVSVILQAEDGLYEISGGTK